MRSRPPPPRATAGAAGVGVNPTALQGAGSRRWSTATSAPTSTRTARRRRARLTAGIPSARIWSARPIRSRRAAWRDPTATGVPGGSLDAQHTYYYVGTYTTASGESLPGPWQFTLQCFAGQTAGDYRAPGESGPPGHRPETLSPGRQPRRAAAALCHDWQQHRDQPFRHGLERLDRVQPARARGGHDREPRDPDAVQSDCGEHSDRAGRDDGPADLSLL